MSFGPINFNTIVFGNVEKQTRGHPVGSHFDFGIFVHKDSGPMGSETHGSRTSFEIVEPDNMPSVSPLNDNKDVILSVFRVGPSVSL